MGCLWVCATLCMDKQLGEWRIGWISILVIWLSVCVVNNLNHWTWWPWVENSFKAGDLSPCLANWTLCWFVFVNVVQIGVILEDKNLLRTGLHQFGLWGIFLINDCHGKAHITVSSTTPGPVGLACTWEGHGEQSNRQPFSMACTHVPTSLPTLTSLGDRLLLQVCVK